MKKHKFIWGAALTMVLAACSDDLTENTFTPVQSGQEIIFGSAISKENNTDAQGVQLKTLYGDRNENGIPVLWNPEGDTIAIFCPNASAPLPKRLVNYVVKPDENAESSTWNTSAWVEKEKLQEAGLQWGEEDEHRFYALYPARNLKDATNQDEGAVKHGILQASIATTQTPVKFYERIDPETRGTVFAGLPDMNHAYMWAHSHVKKSEIKEGSPINLKFKNMVTVLDITVPGPAKEDEEVTITNINVTSTDPNDWMTGDFQFVIKEGENEEQGSCHPIASKNSNEVRNNISIPCYDREKKKFITLKGPNQKLVVKAYIVPDNREGSAKERTMKITVAMLNGSEKTKTLQAKLEPQKVNRIILPRIEKADPAYWMSNLDPNIYVTELSIPGSKMSYSTTQSGKIPAFQNKSISEQFEAGVRSFIVQVTEKGQNLVVPKANNIDFSETLKEITTKLNEAKDKGKTNEFAVVVVTAETNSPWNWIKAIEHSLKEYANNPEILIYKEEITPQTTIADVGNKIILKVNYNSLDQEGYIDKNSNVPAMFAIWKNPAGEKDFCPVSNLYWGNMQRSATMKWMAAEVTHVGKNGASAEISKENKEKSIINMLENSVNAYLNNDAHDTWFMTDAGGVYVEEKTSWWQTTTSYSTTDLATDMNMLVVDKLQTRSQNASTGLVFINFADRDPKSGVLYMSDYILASVIDNNFKFNLRRKQ